MDGFWEWVFSLPTVVGIIIATLFATAGWLYVARRQRMLLRQQHTFNALLAASFNRQFQDAVNTVRPHIRGGSFPDLSSDEHAELRMHAGFLLNHYEFLAAGIRNGDVAEELLRDSERGTIIGLFEVSEPFVTAVRDSRRRQSTFEHLEWLYCRWHEKPPNWWLRMIERSRGRPLYYDTNQWWVAATCAVLGTLALVYVIRVP